MKKNFILALPCIAAVAFATFVGKKALEASACDGNSLLMQNVEALTQNEEQTPCNNASGYRSWATRGFLQFKREFYDCCYILQEGYSPEGICRK